MSSGLRRKRSGGHRSGRSSLEGAAGSSRDADGVGSEERFEIVAGDESCDRGGMADMAMGGDERVVAGELDGYGARERGREL